MTRAGLPRMSALAWLAVTLTVVGCGSGDRAEPGLSPPASSPSSVASPPEPTAAPPTPGDSPTVMTVSGTVAAGVEAGCLVLETSSGDVPVWVLVGATEGLRPGDRVRLDGSPREDLMSYCQQGPLFEVSAATGG